MVERQSNFCSKGTPNQIPSKLKRGAKMVRIPNSFIVSQMPSLKWLDMKYGIEHSYITIDDAAEIALITLDSTSSEAQFELASSGRENSEAAYKLIEKLASIEGQTQTSADKWLFVYLAWVFEQRDRISDPLSVAESLYADFDYPEWLAPIIRFMPVADGDPRGDSFLIEKWEKVLQMQRFELSNDER